MAILIIWINKIEEVRRMEALRFMEYKSLQPLENGIRNKRISVCIVYLFCTYLSM